MYYKIVVISLLSMISSFVVSAQDCETYADYFGYGANNVTPSFSNNSGTLNWSSDWTEIGESDGYAVGNVKVEDNLIIVGAGNGAQRGADLSTCLSAQLYVRAFNRNAYGNAGDQLYYLVSADGMNFDTIGSHTYTGATSTASITESYFVLPVNYNTSTFTLKFSSSGGAEHEVTGVVIQCCTSCSYARDESSLGAADGAIYTGMHGDPLYSIDGGATWQAVNTFEPLAAGTYDVLIKQANMPDIYGPCEVEVGSILVGGTRCPEATTRGVQMIINN